MEGKCSLKKKDRKISWRRKYGSLKSFDNADSTCCLVLICLLFFFWCWLPDLAICRSLCAYYTDKLAKATKKTVKQEGVCEGRANLWCFLVSPWWKMAGKQVLTFTRDRKWQPKSRETAETLTVCWRRKSSSNRTARSGLLSAQYQRSIRGRGTPAEKEIWYRWQPPAGSQDLSSGSG